ncbi:glycosyltransferase [Marinilabiliaceae bacterium JC017]|nr:glycosyltransferase [Marinilabiliaceae bacterium JC017]
MENRVVVHYIQDYLDQTLTWIYGQINHNSQYKHVVVAKKTKNVDQFPLDEVYCLKDQLSGSALLYNRIISSISKNYPFFHKVVKNSKAKVIHAHFGHVGYKAIGLSQQHKIPLITSFYGYDATKLAKKEKYKKRYKILFQKGHRFLVEGNNMKKVLMQLGCPENKVTVFHLGVNVEDYPFRIRTVSPDKPIKFLFAATFTEKKGAQYVIKAFAKVREKHPNAVLKLIGDGPEKELLTDLISSMGIGNAVEREGYVPYETLVDRIYEADVFIQPSVTASDGNTEGGAPVALIDAQATGIPILATFHADIPEVVVHEKTGLLAPERDVDALAENMLKLIETPGLCETLGQNGRKHIEENYNIIKQGKVLGRIYDNTTFSN